MQVKSTVIAIQRRDDDPCLVVTAPKKLINIKSSHDDGCMTSRELDIDGLHML